MTGRILHGGDEVLRGVFWDLGQIGSEDGPKYSEPVRRRLAAKVLEGRAHEPLVFRLCHLVRAAAFAGEDGESGWLEYFCDPEAGSAGRAAGWFRTRLPVEEPGAAGGAPAVTAATGHVALRYPDRTPPVTVSWGAMPMLAAFMEFLLNTLSYDTLHDAASALSRPDLGWRDLQDTANTLSRSVYAWLREHTRPVQDSRHFGAMARFLAARKGQGDFAAEDIDDAAVLAFWRTASLEPGSEFRTFRKTFRAFLRFGEALREELLRDGLENPEILGAAAERAGREPADPSSPGLDRMRAPWPADDPWEGPDEDGDASPLEVLAGSEIKLLLASEARRLALVDAHPGLLPPLVHSLLRDTCFGQVQARISQALRTDPAAARALIAKPPEAGYDREAEALEALLGYLDDLMLATAAALAGAGGTRGAVRRLDFETLGRGRRVLKGMRRRGFDAVRAGDTEALAELRRTVPSMTALRERLAPVCERLQAGAPWAPREREDREVFTEQFARIYGNTGRGEGGTAS